jgi:hypothetical protein
MADPGTPSHVGLSPAPARKPPGPTTSPAKALERGKSGAGPKRPIPLSTHHSANVSAEVETCA